VTEPVTPERIGEPVSADTLMMTGTGFVTRPVERHDQHPALLAWMRTSSASNVPTGAISFGAQRRSKPARALLLQDALPDGRGVVAKRSSAARCAHERWIYERVLPTLGVPRLACYGAARDEASPSSAGEQWWLFIEDARGRPYHPTSDLRLKFEWLAAAHRASARLRAVAALPDRGMDFERRRLRVGLAALHAPLREGTLSPAQAATVRATASCLERLLLDWSALAARYARLPRVLVHGDLADKNSRVRRDVAGDTFLAFDWEMAGQSPPLLDLAELADPGHRDALLAYSETVRKAHPAMDPPVVLACARLGALLRNAAAIVWEALSLRSRDPSYSVERIAEYHENVCAWLAALGGSGD
jgi:hypothetical protein